jgi:hypothetical protein
VRRLPAVLLLVVLLVGCNGVTTFSAFSNPGVSNASGVVSIVRFTAIIGPSGTFVNVTIVTLVQNGFSNDNTFCGDVRNHFPMNTFVNVNFNPGQPCNTVVTVIP